MLAAQIRELIVETARHLIGAREQDRIDTAEVMLWTGLRAEDPAVRDVFREIRERGELKLEGSTRRGSLPHTLLLPDD